MRKDLETRVATLENRVSAIEKKLTADSSAHGHKKRKISLNEFLKEKAPQKMMDIIVVLAAYHDKYEESDHFTFGVADMNAWHKKAKLKIPKNTRNLITQNIRKGYFEEDGKDQDGKMRWYITNSGNEIVEKKFDYDG